MGCKQPVVGGTAQLPSGVVTSYGARCCNCGIIAERSPVAYAQFGNKRQRREQRSAATRPRWVSESLSCGNPAVASGRWPVARTGSHRRRREPKRRSKTKGPRPKTARIRFRAVPTLPEEAAPLVGRVKHVDAASCRVRSVQVAACGTSVKRQDAASTTWCVLPCLRFPRTLVQARGGDMPRGMARAWHVTRGPIPRGPKNGMGDRASHNARSPGGLLRRYRRGIRALRQNGGLRRTVCSSGSRKPRIAKDQPAVAGIRAYLPAALVVGRTSIRPPNAGRMGKSVLPAAVLLSERSYTIPAGPISSRVSGDRRMLTVAGGYGKMIAR